MPAQDNEQVTVTINGTPETATISGGAGGFSIDFPTAAIPASATPYTINYYYPGDAALNAAGNTATGLDGDDAGNGHNYLARLCRPGTGGDRFRG